MVESKGENSNDNHHESDGGVESGAGGRGLKKGPWTAAEDGILIEYVKKHGEGNWNAVQKHAGLARCGKSCRLRWANHLRPNLKKGSFSQDEERVIIELHAKLGNKWARMAAQLPGRTDNEIKNFWNTRMKRRQRAGLPLYPQQTQHDTAAFHLQRHHQHPSSAVAAANFSAFHNNSDFNNANQNSLPIFNLSSTINNTHNIFSDGSSFYATPISQFSYFPEKNTGGAFALPRSPVSPVSPFRQIGPQFNQSLSPPPPQLGYGHYMHDSNSSLNSMIYEAPYHHPVPGLETELPSIQTPPRSTTPASSRTSGGGGGNGIMAAHNSGLLDVVLMEAEARARNGKQWKEERSGGGEVERTVEEEEAAATATAAGENHPDEFSSSDSSSRKRPRIEPPEMDSMEDDDLMSLLNNFQSEMSVPEWYPGNDNGVDLGIMSHMARHCSNWVATRRETSSNRMQLRHRQLHRPRVNGVSARLVGTTCPAFARSSSSIEIDLFLQQAKKWDNLCVGWIYVGFIGLVYVLNVFSWSYKCACLKVLFVHEEVYTYQVQK